MKILHNIIGIALISVLLLSLAIRKDKSLFGNEINKKPDSETINIPQLNKEYLKALGFDESIKYKKTSDNTWKLQDNTVVISSMPYANRIIGYNGTTPIFIAIKDDKIVSITHVENDETPAYWNRLFGENLFEKWNKLNIKEASELQVNTVSGATYSSTAIIENVKVTLSAINKDNSIIKKSGIQWNFKTIVAIIAILSSIVISLIKNKKLRIIQLIINAFVLGFWCQNYLSLSLLVNWFSHGINIGTTFILLILAALAILMPIFGKADYYCNHLCPLGSTQELLSKVLKYKIKINPITNKILQKTRLAIFIVLIISMYIGVGFDIIQYELFSIFMFEQADTVIIILASIFMILSVITPRPYCRFVCPTGQTLRLCQGKK